jgi:hypothetical protein
MAMAVPVLARADSSTRRASNAIGVPALYLSVSQFRAGRRFPWPLIALAALAAVWLGLACRQDEGTEGTIEITLRSPTATPEPTATATPTPEPTPTPRPVQDVCGVNPDPAAAAVLQVQEPQPGEKVKNPFHVRGWGSEIGFQDSGVVVALVTASGDPLPPKTVPPESRAGRIAPGGLKITDYTAPFATDVLVSGLSAATPYCLWVFLSTTEEGIPRQVVQVPVTVTP